MKKLVIISIFSILTSACHINSESEILEGKHSCLKLSPCIEDAFAYYIKHEINHDTSTIYLMEFIEGEPGLSIDDTLICFCAYNKRPFTGGLQGIMTIGDYKVLVFDKKKVGSKFYNADSLIDTDINRIRISSSDNHINCCAFVLDGDSLFLLGCQPDDFVPIKIDRTL